MIKSFKNKRLKRLYKEDADKGLDANHVDRLRRKLTALDAATGPNDLSMPAWAIHPLKGSEKGVWALTVEKNWRLTFIFVGEDVELLDYRDYR